MKISCLIIDDEPLARKRLLSLVKDTPELNCIGQSKTGKEAITVIKKLNPDLLFLDIQMKDMTGFDVLKKIKTTHNPLVIFVTAFDEYALKAFDFFAFDYLLKPFKKERFNLSIKKVMQHLREEKPSVSEDRINKLLAYMDESSTKNNTAVFKNKLPIKTGKTVSFISISTIKYICASGSYIDIHTSQKTHVLRSSLRGIISEMDAASFIRIHRSTIINLEFISKIINSSYGEVDVKMNDNKQFRVSKSYKKEFQKMVGV